MQVGEFIRSIPGGDQYEPRFVEASIVGNMLTDLADEDLVELIGVKSKISRRRILEAVRKLTLADTTEEAPVAESSVPLPPGKAYHFFCCEYPFISIKGLQSLLKPPWQNDSILVAHKKSHSLHGELVSFTIKLGNKADGLNHLQQSESLARNVKDILESQFDLVGFFDTDDLTQISLENMQKGVISSAVLLVFLNDESMQR